MNAKVVFAVTTRLKEVFLQGIEQSDHSYKCAAYDFGNDFPVGFATLYCSEPADNAGGTINSDGDVEVTNMPYATRDNLEALRAYYDGVGMNLSDTFDKRADYLSDDGTFTNESAAAYTGEAVAELVQKAEDNGIDGIAQVEAGEESDPDNYTLTIHTDYLDDFDADGFDTGVIEADGEYYNVATRWQYFKSSTGAATTAFKIVTRDAGSDYPYAAVELNDEVGSMMFTKLIQLSQTQTLRQRYIICMPGARSPLRPSLMMLRSGGISDRSGLQFNINAGDVSTETWTSAAKSVASYAGGKLNGLGDNAADFGRTSNIMGQGLKNSAYDAYDKADWLGGMVNNTINSTKQSETAGAANAVDSLRSSLLDRYRQSQNPEEKSAIRKALEDAAEQEQNLRDADVQNQFTQNTCGELDAAGGALGLTGQGGASLAFAGVSFFLGAANDTRSAGAMRDYSDFQARMAKYDAAAARNGWARTNAIYDPSGVVYEAVLSNPVEGATVTLYYNGYNDDTRNYRPTYDANGNLTSAAAVAGGILTEFDGAPYLNQQNPLTSDSDGRYAWDVPEGLWYVKAEKTGYSEGNSNSDPAAIVTGGGYNWLPVLPPQVDVNSPLVSAAAPVIESVSADASGVTVVFSKYMSETGLAAEKFALTAGTVPIAFTFAKADSEASPLAPAVSYTKTVRLSASLAVGSTVNIAIADGLSSYAGTAFAATDADTVVSGSIPSASDGGSDESPSYHSLIEFSITSGDDQTIVNRASGAKFSCNMLRSVFDHLLVDENTVAVGSYTATEQNGTQVTLSAAYLSSLADGRHTVTFVGKGGGRATAVFYLGGHINPNTGVRCAR